MAFDYGSKTEPGIVTDVSSALTVSASGGAPSDVGITGQADLANGTAQANSVYQVTRASKARDWFGENSLLTNAVVDAIDEGAYPVYAVATDMISVTGEDLSGLTSNTGYLNNEAVSENASDILFNIGGSNLTTVIEYGDVASMTPGSGEVYVDPTTGQFHIDDGLTVGNTGDYADYTYSDYATAHDTMATDAGNAIDFLVPLCEAASVKNDAQTTVGNMANDYKFAIALVGAGARIDVSAYTNSFDDSRVQVVYPTRDSDENSTLGSYAGMRASLGISTTPINKRLDSQKNLAVSLSKPDRGSLIDKRVVPLDEEAAGARIADDVNTVTDSNTEESGIRFGFTRLTMDYVLGTVRVNEQPFIGRLNSPAVRAALEGLLTNQLKTLTRSNAIIDYNVRVTKIDATTAAVEIQIETAKPLRFIENTVTIGA